MKVTKSYINQIIKEELSIVLENANINQALMRIPLSVPRGIEVTLDISNNSIRGTNLNGVERFDDFVMIAYLVADKSLNPEEKALKFIMKMLSTEVGSQVFFDNLDEQTQGRIKSMAKTIAGERGLDSEMIVRLKNDLQSIGSFGMRSMDDYNKLTQAIEQARKGAR